MSKSGCECSVSRVQTLFLFTVMFLLSSSYIQPIPYPTYFFPTTGPRLAEIEVTRMESELQFTSLIENETDLMADFMNPEELQTTPMNEYVEISETPRNGYGYLTINCNKYPLNITAFRRALAFALDKEEICEEGWGGLASPQDSCVPQMSFWGSERRVGYDYYQSNISYAVQLLDDAGFHDVNSDNFRESPDGNNLSITLLVAASSEIGRFVCQEAATAFDNLGVRNRILLDDTYGDIGNRLYNHLDYDIIFTGRSFQDTSVEWLAYEYWSEYADKPRYNYPNFRNASYDAWRDQLINSADYEEVYTAAIEMQKIILYECPIIPCYQNRLLNAYRTDRFVGWQDVMIWQGVNNWWTFLGLRLINGSDEVFEGTLRVSTRFDISIFSILFHGTVTGLYGDQRYKILRLLYDSLLMLTPSGEQIPWLGNSYQILTDLGDSSNIGRIVFEVNSSARWSDGTPITPDDVAYCLNFYKNAEGLPLGQKLTRMVNASVNADGLVSVEFNGSSFWNLHTIANLPILPRSLLVNSSAWWDSEPTPEELITSGPFVISSRDGSDGLTLVPNPYYYRILNETEDNSSLTTPSAFSGIIPTIVAVGFIAIAYVSFRVFENRSRRTA